MQFIFKELCILKQDHGEMSINRITIDTFELEFLADTLQSITYAPRHYHRLDPEAVVSNKEHGKHHIVSHGTPCHRGGLLVPLENMSGEEIVPLARKYLS